MSGSKFEKVLMDRTFKDCHSIYDRLSSLLEEVEIKQVGDIKEINKKILTLSNEMHKLLCIAESVKIYDKKLKGTLAPRVTLKDPPTKLSGEGARISKISEDASQQEMSRNLMSTIYNSISYKDGRYNCNYCIITLKNFEDVVLHTRSQKHKYICKMPSDCFNNILRGYCNIGAFWRLAPSDLKINMLFIQPTGFTCTLCNCSLPYPLDGIYTHILGRKHLKNMPMALQLQ